MDKLDLIKTFKEQNHPLYPLLPLPGTPKLLIACLIIILLAVIVCNK